MTRCLILYTSKCKHLNSKMKRLLFCLLFLIMADPSEITYSHLTFNITILINAVLD